MRQSKGPLTLPTAGGEDPSTDVVAVEPEVAGAASLAAAVASNARETRETLPTVPRREAKSQGVAMVSSTEAPHLKAGVVASGADIGPDTSDAVHQDAVLEKEGKTVPLPPRPLPMRRAQLRVENSRVAVGEDADAVVSVDAAAFVEGSAEDTVEASSAEAVVDSEAGEAASVVAAVGDHAVDVGAPTSPMQEKAQLKLDKNKNRNNQMNLGKGRKSKKNEMNRLFYFNKITRGLRKG